MIQALLNLAVLLSCLLIDFSKAQSPGEPGYGYNGYKLDPHGNPLDVLYATADTPPPANVSILAPEPDVYLNVSVHVGIIELTVDNITAKVNLDAQVSTLR